jgi:hypothetical protein
MFRSTEQKKLAANSETLPGRISLLTIARARAGFGRPSEPLT